MARPTKQRPPEQTDAAADANINDRALVEAGQAADIHAQQLALVSRKYAIDMPYEYERFIARGRELVVETGMRMMELGLILIHVREHEAHGQFLSALERIGVAPRFAQRAMQAAVKLSERPRIQDLGVSKALELVAEDDETLDMLEAGGTLAGLTLDAIDRMSVRELKATLRDERDEHADEKSADEEIIRKKDERINKLSRRSTRSAAREQVSELLADLDAYTVEAATFIKQMSDTIGAINTIYADANEQVDEEVQQRIETNLCSAVEWNKQLVSELGE
jgi:hypothetical protein